MKNYTLFRLLSLILLVLGNYAFAQTAQNLPYIMPNNAGQSFLSSANGWIQNGIGTDYSSSGSNIKFDTSADVATLFLSSTPNLLSFNLKGNGLSGNYIFDLLESADGTTFSIAQSITTGINGTNTVFQQTLATTTRYIRFRYTTKAVGNIGFGGVSISAGSVSTPNITTSISSVSGLNYILGSGPSASQNITVSASNLSPDTGNLLVSSVSNFEVSLDNSAFSNSVSIPYTASTISSQIVYVRLKSGLTANTYSENLTISGGTATDKTVALSGTITAPFGLPYENGFRLQSDLDSAISQGFAFTGSFVFGASGGYLKIASGQNLISPTLNFSQISILNISLSTSTFGGNTGQQLSVLISNDNGNSYTLAQTITIPANYETANLAIDLSSNNSTTGKVKFEMISGSNSIRFRDLLMAKGVSWDGTAWSNTTGPDTTTQATIAGVYSTTTNGTFTAKNVVIQSGSLTINSGTNLTIQDGVENQLTETAFVIEDNANLIQTNALATNFGSATVKTNSAPMVRLDYTAWASPVIAQKLKAFSPQTLDARFYTYDPVTNAYAVVATPVTTNLETGVGYLIRASDVSSPTVASSYNAQFIGIPVNGTKTTPVSIGFNLLGNPYASKLDAATFLTNANTTALGISTLHFWTHTVAAVGGIYPANNYASYNATGGTAAAAGGTTPGGTIAVGQGFFVNPTSAGNVTFDNTMRTTTVSTQFFKVASVVNAPSDRHRFWLNLTTPTTANNQILIGYVADASNDFDAKYDAALFGNTASVIYSKVADYKLAIQGRSSFATTDVLPLGLQATEAGQFTISLADFDGLFVSQNIFLKDNVLNTIQNLKLGSYTFNATQGEFASRFEIVFDSSLLSTNSNVFNDTSVIVIKNNNGISIETGNNTMANVAVYDIRGRLLVTKTNINASTVTLNNVATANQVLIVKITNTNNQTVTKKVVN
jgi:hypothetical protein